MDVVQPASFAVFVSLAALWRAHGVEPDVVVGHSQGEIAAAHVAGALTLEDAARVAALRSAALVDLAGAGGMMSVFLPAGEVLERIAPYEGRLSLASYNGPRSTVVAGEPQALRDLLASCEAAGERARMIAVDYASHTAQIEAIRERLLADLEPIRPRRAAIAIMSTTTAGLVDGAGLDAAHWYRNLREPVRFEQATRALVGDGVTAFVESSPHPVLTWAVQETVDAAAAHPRRVAVVGSLRRDDGGPARFLASAGEAFAAGVEVDWEAAFDGAAASLVGLPSYPFQRTRFWLSQRSGGGGAQALTAAGLGPAEHPLLGAAVELAGRPGSLLTGRLSLGTHPWLADHELHGEAALPASAFAEIALRAAAHAGCDTVEELIVTSPLALGAEGAVQLQVAVGDPDEAGRCSIDVHARPDVAQAPWTRHATGTVARGDGLAGHEPIASWPPPGAAAVDVDELYDRLAGAGRAYGPAFQAVRAAWRVGEELFAELALGEDESADGARFELHPALLDAALHPALAARDAAGSLLPARWTGIRVHARGALAARVRIAPGADGDLRLTATGADGEPLLSVDAVSLSAVGPPRTAAGREGALEALYRVRWTAPASPAAGGAPPRLAALGDAGPAEATRFEDLAAFAASAPPPGTVLVAAPAGASGALALLQAWLADERLAETRLAVLVPRAAAVHGGEVADPVASAIRGLVRSAQSEHPGRLVSIDADARAAIAAPDAISAPDAPRVIAAPEAIAAALAAGEAEVSVRDGAVLVPRLVRALADAPPSGAWRLAPERAGELVAAAPAEGDGDRPLARGEVRLAVRAAGVNPRDVLVAIGVHAGSPPLGIEAAGVVAEVGPGVTGLAAGDRVMGFVPGAFGPLAVADHRLLAPVPAGWSFAQAAAAPVAQCAAQLALGELAGLREGERVLVHAAAGGVGMAAVHLAQRIGAEVFATASPAKWDVLRELGIDDAHIASSRDRGFAERFGAATGGEGVDVVLNSLGGALVDASLSLLPRGGRFVELGTADVRDPAAVAAAHPGVAYAVADLLGSEPQRLGAILRDVAGRMERGEPAPPRLTAWDVRDGSEALAFVGRARHAGKVVLTIPRALDPRGTVLVTGGTGGLGAVVAEHLARAHGVRRLLLVSRRGPAADGAQALCERLAELGCHASVAACDVGDRDALARLLAAIDPGAPLTAVVHAAGTIDNAMVRSLDAAALDAVMRPKADAARWLDELTAGLDLAAFVMFSSVAATFSHPGQGNYAAANAYLDGLAARRRAAGLPATAVAWGLWGTERGMSSRLSREDVEVLAADTGQRVLPAERALALLDVALVHREPLLVATTLDLGSLRAQAREGMLPALLSELVRAPARRPGLRVGAGASLARQLASAPADERPALVLDVVRAQAAAVLGHRSAGDVPPERTFKELGFDSLGSVVLRNRLTQITGLDLPSTLVFDHPTPLEMAAFLRSEAEAHAAHEDGGGEDAAAAAGSSPVPHAPAARAPRTPAPAPVAAGTDPDVPPPAPPDDPAASSVRGAAGAPPATPATTDAAPQDRRYRGRVLSSIAAAARGLRFRTWVLRNRARLARLGCRLVVETRDTPRFEGLPRLVVDAIGDRRGTLTLRIGRGCRLGRDLTLDVWTHADGLVELGDACSFQDHVRLQPWGGRIRIAGGVHVRDGAELKSKGELSVGPGSAIGRNATIHCHARIELADHVAVAEGANVMDSDHTHDGSDTHFILQRVVSAPVRIDSNVLVGTNAMVLRGSHVGRNAVIAAGAVLTGGEYPAGHLLAGAPAQALRPLTPGESRSA